VAVLDSYPLSEVRRIEARLVIRYCPPLEPEQIRDCVHDCLAMYETATVRTYVAVLVERTASTRLRALVRDLQEGGDRA
jgi:hypothetical protein